MKIEISSKKISSFVGDVLPLRLSGEDLRAADIKWSVTGDAVHIRTFEKDEFVFRQTEKLLGFKHAILVTLDKPGTALITAEYNGEKYVCSVEVRAAVHTESGRMNYYTADLHNHTTMIHRHDELHKRCGDFQEDYVRYMKEHADIDLSVISDHADVIDAWEFFKGFDTVEAAKPMETVILPGAESEITLIEIDRYGESHKNSGEIVTLSADNFAAVGTYEDFFERMSTSPHIIAILAHPQVVGFDKNGIWNFSLEKHRDDGFKNAVKLVEMGDGNTESRDDDIINEFIYSVALDNGYRVSTTCSSDKHEAPWGKAAYKGKTIVMAPESSKEAFLDALRNGRCYCSESGNIKLYCEVNGKAIPCDLEPVSRYHFHAEVDYFESDECSVPVKCSVISDYGKCVKEISGIDFSSFDFEVESDTARWFYLRFEDKNHKKTLSPPIYCGRKYDDVPTSQPKAVDKSEFEARELLYGSDASSIINDNPLTPWESEHGDAEILIDMKKEVKISALGHYPYRLIRRKDVDSTLIVAAFAGEYKVSLSSDGKDFRAVAEGAIRVYGGEIIIRFEPQTARYVKFKVKSNVGKMVGYERYSRLGLKIGELTVFE